MKRKTTRKEIVAPTVFSSVEEIRAAYLRNASVTFAPSVLENPAATGSALASQIMRELAANLRG